MHICYVCVEIFAWGKYGGFGRATRTLGRELVREGVTVSAVVPRREGQGEIEQLDGITVYGFSPFTPWSAVELFRRCDADLYHSQEPSWGTVAAMAARPDRKHVVTFRDTRDAGDWWVEFLLPSMGRLQVLGNLLYEDNPLVRRAVRDADGRFCASRHLVRKAVKKYGLTDAPEFLPTPVRVPTEVEKAAQPTICFNARWDRRKRPERFFELAARCPDLRFVAVGQARDPRWEAHLRRTYGGLPNLELVGFLDQFGSDRLTRILGESWVLVSTASREGLPNAFIEAAAHRCAILSAVDPDGFASRFGHHAADLDFEKGLRHLLENDRWRGLGELAHRHVLEHFEMDQAVTRHLDEYERLLSARRSHRQPSIAHDV